MKPKDIPCPFCGEEIPANSTVCPHCGSDEQTGWSEQRYLDGIDLGDEPLETNFRKTNVWAVVAMVIIILFTLAILL